MEALLAEAAAWRRAIDLRAYIAAVEERAADGKTTVASSELLNWLSWAREQADRLDPVTQAVARMKRGQPT